jgi:hypothetical protein
MLQSPDRNGVSIARGFGMQVDSENVNVMHSWQTRHKVSIPQAVPGRVSVCETATLLSQTHASFSLIKALGTL